MGGNTYNSFYVNSNGTLSFGSIESFLAPQNSYSSGTYTGPPPQTSLGVYSVPIFSPNFSDGPGYLDGFGGGFDGNFSAVTSVGSNSFTVNWFPCSSGYPLTCGAFSMNLVASATYNPADLGYVDDLQRIILYWGNSSCPCTSLDQQFAFGQQNLLAWMMNNLPVYTMTLTDLSDGFRVDYSYDPAATGQSGVYGFNVPSGLDQTSGPLENRSYLFNSLGQLIAVPEPKSWMTMLLGFLLLGFALRREQARVARAQ
jgi:hypothetical protein